MQIDASETRNKIKERMFAVIELVENTESVQIAVNQHYFNKWADKLFNAVCNKTTENTVMLVKSWYEKLLDELHKLRAGIITNSDIILKYNNCLE